MPLTAYCKKCGQDVPAGDTCPLCGRALAKSSLRVAWCVTRRPVRDWMRWNAAARFVLPAFAFALALLLLLEYIGGGGQAVETLLRSSGVLYTMLMLLALIALLVAIVLRLQGDGMIDCILDSKGVHVQEYLPYPTPLRLIMRLRSPALMDNVDWSNETPVALISQKEIAWRDIARVQLWPEKQLILLYAPRWWMRVAVYATPFTWDDALAFIREKIGRKKGIELPGELTAAPQPRKPKAAPPPAPQYEQPSLLDQSTMDEPHVEAVPQDAPPLEAVLQEVQALESSGDAPTESPTATE